MTFPVHRKRDCTDDLERDMEVMRENFAPAKDTARGQALLEMELL